jgi:hypothetical protein
VKIIIGRHRNIYSIYLRNSLGDEVWINDEGHTNLLSEVEAMARAKSLRAVTGWVIESDHEL